MLCSVRRWNHRQQRLRDGLVGGKCGQCRDIGADRRAIGSGANVAEVATALGNRWNYGVKALPRNEIFAPLLRPEEKCLVLVPIEDMRDVNRPPNGIAVIVLLVLGARCY